MIVESVAGVVSAVRDDDLVGRVGGDEFMVFMRDVYDPRVAMERSEASSTRSAPWRPTAASPATSA